MPKQVFVSWSHREGEADGFVGELERRLRAADIDVWIDWTSLQPGDDWHPAISAGLQFCNAGVVVLSAAGKDSPWVAREANILQWRGDAFGIPVLPVLLPGTTEADLRSDLLAPARLDARQAVDVSALGDDDAIAAVVDALRALKPARSPFERLLDKVADYLRDVPATLAGRVLDGLTDGAVDATMLPSRAITPAQRLVAALILAPRPAYLEALRELGGDCPRDLTKLPDLLQPFRWIESTAVDRLLYEWERQFDGGAGQAPAFVINATQVGFAPPQYRARAFLKVPYVARVPTVYKSRSEFEAAVCAAIEDAVASPQALEAALESCQRDREVVVVEAHLPDFDPTDIEGLRRRFPSVTWMVLLGPTLPQGVEPDAPPPCTHVLKPLLGPTAEADAIEELRKARRNISPS